MGVLGGSRSGVRRRILMREVGWKMGRMERRSGLSGSWSFLSVVHVTVESGYPRSHCVVWQRPFARPSSNNK